MVDKGASEKGGRKQKKQENRQNEKSDTWLCDGYGELLKMKEVGAQVNRVKEDEREALLSKDAHNAIHKLCRIERKGRLSGFPPKGCRLKENLWQGSCGMGNAD